MYRITKSGSYGGGASTLGGSPSTSATPMRPHHGGLKPHRIEDSVELDDSVLERNLCHYGAHLCRREKLPNFEFCMRHILEDKSAPFKQCSYNIKSQKRCPKPAPKADKRDGYCADHARKSLIARQKAVNRKRPQDLTQRCLNDLNHYKKPKTTTSATATSSSILPSLSALNPVSSVTSSTTVSAASTPAPTPPIIDNNADVTGVVEAALPKVMLIKPDEDNKTGFLDSPEKAAASSIAASSVKEEKAVVPPPPPPEPELDPYEILSKSVSNPKTFDGSEIESEEEENVLDSWRMDGDSDAESVDSDMENPLRHAGGYSAEEVIRIMRDKLIRLQKSYIDQFQRLQYLLREERRAYKHAVRREKETMMSIHQQPKPTPEERSAYYMLKSLNHYSKPHGKDAVFSSAVKQKRHQTVDGSANSSSKSGLPKCVYNITSNTKCGEIVIPLTKYCTKHIMEDSNQILFRHCGVITEADEGPCENPIIDSFEGSTCVYHTPLPPSYSQTQEESSTTTAVKDEPTFETTTSQLCPGVPLTDTSVMTTNKNE